MKKSRWFFATIVITTILNLVTGPVIACGPFIEQAVLTYDDNPDLPLKNFLAGELGIVRPSWHKSYPVVAYRTLSNKPFTSQQQDAVYKLWRYRIQRNVFSGADETSAQSDSQAAKPTSVELWQKARSAVPGFKSAELVQYRRIPDAYDTYLNCPDASFDNATTALKKKIAQHGISSPFVKDWLAAQDLVFCHCASPGNGHDSWSPGASKTPEPPFPSLPAASLEPEAKDDRAYQHAAALFYAEQYEQSFKEFAVIASETKNPYAKISRYMMPRCLIRKATITKLSDANLHSAYAQAEKLIREMIVDKTMSELKQPCEELLGFVLFRSDPANRLRELASQVVSDDKSVTWEQYFRSLDDYTLLLESLEGGARDPYANPPAPIKVPPIAKNDDLSDWMVTWERDDKNSFSHALERWHQTHSQAWLLAALHLAPANMNQTEELLQAVSLVAAESPAYMPLGYESAQLHLRRGESDEAIKEAESLKNLALKKHLWSAANLLMDLRGRAPIDLGKFVENSIRIPAAFAYLDEYLDEQFSPDKNSKKRKKAEFVFGMTNAEYMNERVPLKMLVEIASDARLPEKLRADAEQAAWVRAVVLDDTQSQNKLLPALVRDYPQLASLFKAAGSDSAADRKFAAVYLILKNPGMRPYVTGGAPREEVIGRLDTYTDNWWDNHLPDQSITYSDKGEFVKSKLTSADYPKLLSAQQSKIGLDNQKQLLATGAAPTFLCAAVADYAATHKGDSRVPEALYLAVRAAHYGHREGRTTPMSKKCFALLHTNYPKNPYTAKTPYYY
jgi:hypothetical protein